MGSGKLWIGIGVVVGVARRPDPETAAREHVPHRVEVRSAEPHRVRRQVRVARVDHAHRGRHEEVGVEHHLAPDRVADRAAEGEVRRAPDLAVGVDLRADDVVADVGVVQRAVVHPVVSWYSVLGTPAGHPRADRERVLTADRNEPVRVQVLHRDEVRPGLAHRAGLEPGEPGVRPADHPVRDRVRVLVPDHAHVEVAIDAGRVEVAGDRLPQVHVRVGRQPILGRDLVGVVAGREPGRPAGDPAGLRAADLPDRGPCRRDRS